MRLGKAVRPRALRAFRWPRLWLGVWIFGWVLAVFGSLLPAALLPPMPDLPEGDKWLHLVAYFLLGGWAMAIFGPAWARWRAMLGLAALGLVLEFAQALLTSNRFGEGLDLAANTAGLVLAWWLGPATLGRWIEAVDRNLG